MSHPTTRVLAMLELLQTRRELTGPELADRLGVDERTVRRYALRLAELGIPVEARRGRYGGYRLLPGYKLPPLMFTDDEAVAVVLGLLVGQRLGIATDGALDKIRRVLPAQLRDRVAALHETLGFTLMPREGAMPDASVLLVLAAAARDRHRVRLTYRSWKGEDSERELDTYGLVFHSGRWYASGFDHRRGQVRTFRVDRVTSAVPLEATYADPGGFDAVARVTESLASVPYAHEVEVVLETPLADARRRIPPTVGTLSETEGGVLLRTRAERLDGMAQLLAGLGCPFVIRTPEELRGAVRALAEHLVEYSAGP
ncbi:putative DNA-binding transcriptional regulator YafY [Actinoallomurus bryophytorum]|uniref:Putative DNA-binding transcriptional regulator YafY n=1 Tax=Actinoallomurus bryophytorum TaxID=1490222 RepID=A0A543BT78_9ACTN|nr:YafY family protein [Actinoallomurus bryophytorum]TQL88044.1 putative DNA-binding transcriptional regulator YafY [Actinoallomurus bryophytorum]